MGKRLNFVIRNERGISLIELLVGAALTAFVVGLSSMPLIQMKKMERRVEFQSSLDMAHQVALLKARNGSYIKEAFGITPGSQIDSCFGGRMRPDAQNPQKTCANYTKTVEAPLVEKEHFEQQGFKAESTIMFDVACTPEKCNQMNVRISTVQTGGDETLGWKGRALTANFSIPAAALSSRQEIDFSGCVGKMITGINFNTLKAECVAVPGNNTCSNIGASGPMNSFANMNVNDPANCQPPVNKTCPQGMSIVGMINGQAQCSAAMECSDPMSTACSTTTTTAACVPNWQPLANTVCSGQTYIQTDVAGCSNPATQSATGTNAGVCPVNPCNQSGVIKWPDANTGPCEVPNAGMIAAAGSTASLINEKLGYSGNITAMCVDNSPAPNTFNMAAARAASTCNPIVCSVPANVNWSNSGMQSGIAGPGLDTAGPWSCGGALTFNPPTPGMITSVQADSAAYALANNSAATATAGSLTLTCNDPGPANGARMGVVTVSAVSCTPAPVVEPLCWSLDDGFLDPWTRQCTNNGSCLTEGAWTGGKCWNTSTKVMDYPGGSNGNRVQCVKASLGRCNTLMAPSKCWQATVLPVLMGAACEDPAYPNFQGVFFKTQQACRDTAATHPNYHLNCVSGGATAMEKLNIMCLEADVADTSTCSDATTVSVIPVTTTTVPAGCQPDGFQTFLSSMNENTLCTDAYGSTDLGPTPNPICCSGFDKAYYVLGDVVGSSDGCQRKCGNAPVATCKDMCGAPVPEGAVRPICQTSVGNSGAPKIPDRTYKCTNGVWILNFSGVQIPLMKCPNNC